MGTRAGNDICGSGFICYKSDVDTQSFFFFFDEKKSLFLYNISRLHTLFFQPYSMSSFISAISNSPPNNRKRKPVLFDYIMSHVRITILQLHLRKKVGRVFQHTEHVIVLFTPTIPMLLAFNPHPAS